MSKTVYRIPTKVGIFLLLAKENKHNCIDIIDDVEKVQEGRTQNKTRSGVSENHNSVINVGDFT